MAEQQNTGPFYPDDQSEIKDSTPVVLGDEEEITEAQAATSTLESNNTDDDFDFDFDMPDLQQSEDIVEIRDESKGSLCFGILGCGQAGGRIAESFYNLGYKKCIVLNTSNHDLAQLKVKYKLKVGDTDGAGKDMNLSKTAFIKNRSEIMQLMRKVFGKTVTNILVTIGSGGGSGSGMVIPAVELSKSYLKQMGIVNAQQKVGVITTIPTNGECGSPIVKSNALEVLTSLSDLADNEKISPLIVVDNDQIPKLYPNLTVSNFYPTINKTVSQLFNIFNNISTKESNLISFDKADYQSIINCSGHMIFGVANIKEYSTVESISIALRNNLESTLLAKDFDLQTARSVGMIILGGQTIFDNTPGLMSNIEEAFSTMSFLTGNAVVHRGLYSNNSNTLKVFTIVSGLKSPKLRYEKILNT